MIKHSTKLPFKEKNRIFFFAVNNMIFKKGHVHET